MQEIRHHFDRAEGHLEQGILKYLVSETYRKAPKLSRLRSSLDHLAAVRRAVEDIEAEIRRQLPEEPPTETCPQCNGDGFLVGDGFSEDTETCQLCGGSGSVPVQEVG